MSGAPDTQTRQIDCRLLLIVWLGLIWLTNLDWLALIRSPVSDAGRLIKRVAGWLIRSERLAPADRHRLAGGLWSIS